MARVGVLVLLLCAFTAFVATQEAPTNPTAVQQTPGMLERLMETYVYPLRQYDWTGKFTNLMDFVMNYLVPGSKEFKSRYILRDVFTALLTTAETWLTSPSSSPLKEQARLALGYLTGTAPHKNSFVSDSQSAHSYDYLGFLWLFTGLTIMAGLVPLYNYLPEEELLYYDVKEEEMADMGMGMGEMGVEMGGMNMYPPPAPAYGDMIKASPSAEKPAAEGGQAGGQTYDYYNYQDGNGLPITEGGEENSGHNYDYFDYQYGAQDYREAGKRKDSYAGYTHPSHTRTNSVNVHPPYRH